MLIKIFVKKQRKGVLMKITDKLTKKCWKQSI